MAGAHREVSRHQLLFNVFMSCNILFLYIYFTGVVVIRAAHTLGAPPWPHIPSDMGPLGHISLAIWAPVPYNL